MKHLYMLLLLFSLISCKSQAPAEGQGTTATVQSDWKSLAKKELGNSYKEQVNDKGTFVLCTQSRQGDHANKSLQYIVIDSSSGSIVSKGSFVSGYAKWLSDDTIEVASSEGTSSDLTKKTIKIKSNIP